METDIDLDRLHPAIRAAYLDREDQEYLFRSKKKKDSPKPKKSGRYSEGIGQSKKGGSVRTRIKYSNGFFKSK